MTSAPLNTFEQPSPKAKSSHFDRRNAFVDGGWLGRLRPLLAAVWIIYDRYADAQGLAFPSASKIASLIHHTGTNAVHKARTELCKLGLLELVDEGGGNRPAVYRVCTPPLESEGGSNRVGVGSATPPQINTPSRIALPSESTPYPPSNRTNLPPVPPSSREERHIEQHNRGQESDPVPAEGTSELFQEQSQPASKARPKKARKPPEELPEIPATLREPEFITTWEKWQKHRREKKKPLTPTNAEGQLADLAARGPVEAVCLLKRAIQNGWIGYVFERDQRYGAKTQADQRRREQQARECPEQLTPAQRAALVTTS